MKRSIQRYTGLALMFGSVCAFFALIVLANSQPLRAHDDGSEHPHIRPNISDIKRAHKEDAQPPHNLPQLAGAATACSGGFAAGYPCNNVDLLSFLPLASIGGTNGNSAANDIWGWTDSASGREFAIIGRVFGTSFVEITDPVNPVYLGQLSTHGAFGSSWRDIKVYSNHAFIVSEANQHGMQVFDLTQLLSVSNPPVNFSETTHYNKVASAHNIVINEDSGYAYIVGAAGKNSCNGGLHMVDISNPTSPSSAGCFSADGYTHDAQCVIYSGPDTAHQGKEICFNSNEDTITVVDVTNKSNPTQMSRIGYLGANYTHQGWLTEDQAYFILDDELDEVNDQHNTYTYVWDVSDLDNPVLIGTSVANTPNIDHNQYVKGNYTYQAGYRAGLRILDISEVLDGTYPNGAGGSILPEVAYFDIYPADNAAEFNAAWSNYPYYPSGVVVVSGIEQGLYVLQPNLSGGNSTPTPTPIPPTPTNTPVPPTPTNTPVPPTPTNTPEPGATMHVGNLDGSSAPGGQGNKWSATVTITVHDSGEAAVSNATVSGSWSNGTNGSGSCVTNASGQCSITKNNIKGNSSSVTFTVTGVSHATNSYDSGSNHDPGGDSNGTTIVIGSP